MKTQDEQIAAMKKIILDFGNATVNVFDQMLKGEWIDDHGHKVYNNVAMIQLGGALTAATKFAAENFE